MNSTSESSHGTRVTIEDYEYGMGVSFGVLFMFIIITYALWKCILHRRAAARRNSNAGTATSTTTYSISDQGLDEATLLAIPKLLYSETKPYKGDSIASDCSICLADYKDSHMLRQLPYCGHFFHVECIDPWLKLHVTCPVCRHSPMCSRIQH